MESKQRNANELYLLEELADAELIGEILDSQIDLCHDLKKYDEARRVTNDDATVHAGVDISIDTWILQDLYAVAGKRKLDVIEWSFRSYAEEITEWTQAILKEYSREQDEDFLRSLGIAPMQSSEGGN
jgi:hypothetical protein